MKKFLLKRAEKAINPNVMVFFDGDKLNLARGLIVTGAMLVSAGTIIASLSGIRFRAKDPETADGFKQLFDIAVNSAEDILNGGD